ncbi:uncharacterized protein METZ01_LOCUS34719 [marine metagenome]|uniref:Uncharacterized protein n=1 Tax=marine metagenome TaxID=408172 RepID=A0A381QR73_9ZZZZ
MEFKILYYLNFSTTDPHYRANIGQVSETISCVDTRLELRGSYTYSICSSKGITNTFSVGYELKA